MGQRLDFLQKATHVLGGFMPVIAKSDIYESAPWGPIAQDPYLNQALVVAPSLPPQELMGLLLYIEAGLGRVREVHLGPRTLDLDLIYYGSQIGSWEADHLGPALTLPHPRVSQRLFALKPIAQIIPDFVHPVLNLTQDQLLAQCEDTLPVTIWNG